ncbi:MAG: VanZ family protein [Bacteroidia bacterium]|nr:VanZ family protein [Bacteroidia bacterium]
MYPALIWALLIGGLCAIPGQDLPTADWLSLLKADKWIHVALFAILVFLTLKGINQPDNELFFQKYAVVGTLTLCIAYGGTLELMQETFFENRTADVYDFIANSVGCFLGWWVAAKKLKPAA